MGRKTKELDPQAIADMLNVCNSSKKVANMFKVSDMTLYNKLYDAGYKKRWVKIGR